MKAGKVIMVLCDVDHRFSSRTGMRKRCRSVIEQGPPGSFASYRFAKLISVYGVGTVYEAYEDRRCFEGKSVVV